MPELRTPELICKKRDKWTLTDSETKQFVNGVVSGDVTDAQIGAMLMAIFLNGLNATETATLTSAMLESGAVLSWPDEWRGTLVDKHSTGGVGEKTSLVLTPALMACGLRVPMITGRGLGHTGGTLDKLESIPGFCCSFTMSEMRQQMETVGGFMVGATESMVPADRILYATRDVTATVANKSLIAASIMSKKLAESLDALVVTVTYGKAAFMKTEEEARELSEIMIDIGRRRGVRCSCMLLRMDEPLGNAVGNALEVREVLRCLNGEGPADLHDTVCQIGGQLLVSCGQVETFDEGHRQMDKVIRDGSARHKFVAMTTAQGADRALVEKMFTKEGSDILPTASNVTAIKCQSTGYVHGIDAMSCGTLAHQLGAGRSKPSDAVNMAVGLQLRVAVGDRISEGDLWVKVHHDEALTDAQVALIQSAISVHPDPPPGDRKLRITATLK